MVKRKKIAKEGKLEREERGREDRPQTHFCINNELFNSQMTRFQKHGEKWSHVSLRCGSHSMWPVML